MRIKVTRDCVVDKLNPLERSPKHKRIPKMLRSKSKSRTPEKCGNHGGLSPRERKNSFVSPKQKSLLPKNKTKRAVKNLSKLFDIEPKDKHNRPSSSQQSKLEEVRIDSDRDELEQLRKEKEGCVVSLVSLKTDVSSASDHQTPPPLKIKRSWKNPLRFPSCGYKLFTPESPAKAAASPHNLSVKLCFLSSLSDSFRDDEELLLQEEESRKTEMKSKRLQMVR